MLYIIGLGLNDPKDISVKGLEAIKSSDKIFLESYTSLMQCSVEELEEFYGKKVIVSDRELVEQSEDILSSAKNEVVSFLVVGDVFAATTHAEFYKDAVEAGLEVEVIHNATILNAVSITGLQLYKFGKVASIPFLNKDVKAPYEVLIKNKELGLHTLFMLDIWADENKFMTINQALEYLFAQGLAKDTVCVGCARLGSGDFIVKAGSAGDLFEVDFGKPPHCLIVPGDLHFAEEEFLEFWS